MKKRCGRLAALAMVMCAVLMLTLPGFAAAKVVKPTSDFYVRDDADVLSAETIEYIVENNDVLYEETGAQIVFVVLSTTGSTPIKDYAHSLFNEWNIGSSEKNNGLLVLMAIDDDYYFTLQGVGLEDYISSGDLGAYNKKYLEPYFARKEYDQGARALFDALYEKVASVYSAQTRYPQGNAPSVFSAWTNNESNRSEEKSEGGGFGSLVLILIVVIVLVSLFSGNGRKARRSASSGKAGSFFWGMLLGRQLNRNNRNGSWYNSPPPPGGRSSRGGFGGGGFGSGFGGSRSGSSRSGGSRSGGGGRSRGGGAGRGR